MRTLAFSVLAALALTFVPTGAATLHDCPELSILEAVPKPIGGGSAAWLDADGDCQAETERLVTSNIIVRWAHDEPGITGLAVVLEGTGIEPATLPMEESRYVDPAHGGSSRTHYKSPAFYFPSASGGALTATLHRDGAPIAVARAVAVV